MDTVVPATVLEYERLPSLKTSYARLLAAQLRRRRAPRPLVIPRVTASVPRVRIDLEHLDHYREVCGFDGGAEVPLTYPQVLVSGLQAELLLTPAFPLPLLGIVHVRSSIVQRRPVAPGDTLAVTCEIGPHRDLERGLELDVLARVSVGEELAWSSTTTVLWRKAHEKTARAVAPLPQIGGRRVSWALEGNAGRRYARVSGDYNPIHLFALTARLFGYARPIAHGLLVLARCIAELGSDLPRPPLQLEVAFERPVLLPARVLFATEPVGAGIDFAVLTADAAKAHVTGRVRPA